MAKAAKKEIKAAHYNTVIRPLITEKATRAAEHNKITLEVPVSATKGEIKEAVEALYKVTVTKVNTLVNKGKVKLFRGRPGMRSDRKKAIVTLKAGDKVDLMTGV